jgi:ATP-binding cassette subfamily A (ABC1) protein 3
MPIFPAMTILVKLTESQMLPVSYRVLNVDHIPAAVAWFFLFLCIPLWFAIYIYLDSVMPNTYGVQKHPCFCIRKEDKRRKTYEQNDVEDQESQEIQANHEKIFNSEDPILFENLTKTFGEFTAVNKLKFSIKEGEIFAFLGHNGAGKTTAIYMLTGMLKASSGDAYVYGNSINKGIDKVQRNLGLCQQFDVLFDNLTVKEHLKFVCEIKDIPLMDIE